MFEVSMVYAGPDADLARTYGAYLERNCLVHVDYSTLITPERSLLDVIGRALSADVLILFVSPHLVPQPLDRNEWERLLAEAAERKTRIAKIVVAESSFPKLLLKSHVFDSTRALKRWIFGLDLPAERPDLVPDRQPAAVSPAELTPLWEALADGPETARVPGGLAHAFALGARAEFEALFWVDCRGATPAGAAGELGAQLGLRLPYELRENLENIERALNSRRCLAVLEGAAPDVTGSLCMPGRTSWILADAPAPQTVTRDLARSRLAALTSWVTDANPVPGAGEARLMLEWLISEPQHWMLACQFARAVIAYYKFRERFAEVFEVLERMCPEAIRRRDREAAAEFGQERAWILEGWGRTPEAVRPFVSAPAPAEQLALW
jgi:hypothetical protein